ncbi:MAG: hypothetical protein CL920_24070 [Deltaproteobacteria bacterium]|nr:hypothetical protein [Deltaproteobacteria bacterium]|tara:strand:- start:7069 stop:8064 length:996 start_codon:yes stop_codon:yes gene_type:complete
MRKNEPSSSPEVAALVYGNIAVRILGIIMILGGLWGAWKVGSTIYSLFKEPKQVKAFAKAIEHETEINKGIHAFMLEFSDVAQKYRNIKYLTHQDELRWKYAHERYKLAYKQTKYVYNPPLPKRPVKEERKQDVKREAKQETKQETKAKPSPKTLLGTLKKAETKAPAMTAEEKGKQMVEKLLAAAKQITKDIKQKQATKQAKPKKAATQAKKTQKQVQKVAFVAKPPPFKAPPFAGMKVIKIERQRLKPIDFAYFFAWMISLIILFALARLALAIIKAGGQLAITGFSRDKLVKEIAQELRTQIALDTARGEDGYSELKDAFDDLKSKHS